MSTCRFWQLLNTELEKIDEEFERYSFSIVGGDRGQRGEKGLKDAKED